MSLASFINRLLSSSSAFMRLRSLLQVMDCMCVRHLEECLLLQGLGRGAKPGTGARARRWWRRAWRATTW